MQPIELLVFAFLCAVFIVSTVRLLEGLTTPKEQLDAEWAELDRGAHGVDLHKNPD